LFDPGSTLVHSGANDPMSTSKFNTHVALSHVHMCACRQLSWVCAAWHMHPL